MKIGKGKNRRDIPVVSFWSLADITILKTKLWEYLAKLRISTESLGSRTRLYKEFYQNVQK